LAPKKPEPSENEATEQTVSVKLTDLRALMDRIEKLEAQPRVEDIEITTELPQAAGLQPGQYVNIAPPSQAPDLRKVRWTRATIEKTYPTVPLTPRINITVAPHGIPWELHDGQPIDVPSIVRDFHDSEVNRIKHANDRYKPESAMEVIESIQRSKESPGQPVWGRLHIVGAGFNLGPDQGGEPTPLVNPTETKA